MMAKDGYSKFLWTLVICNIHYYNVVADHGREVFLCIKD